MLCFQSSQLTFLVQESSVFWMKIKILEFVLDALNDNMRKLNNNSDGLKVEVNNQFQQMQQLLDECFDYLLQKSRKIRGKNLSPSISKKVKGRHSYIQVFIIIEVDKLATVVLNIFLLETRENSTPAKFAEVQVIQKKQSVMILLLLLGDYDDGDEFQPKFLNIFACERGEMASDFEGLIGDADFDHTFGIGGALQTLVENDPYLQGWDHRGRGKHSRGRYFAPPRSHESPTYNGRRSWDIENPPRNLVEGNNGPPIRADLDPTNPFVAMLR